MRYTLTIAADTEAELIELVRIAGTLRTTAAVAPVMHAPNTGAPECPNGHGVMAWKAGGVIRAGERQGQSYPPFYSCATCKQTINA
jgi:hypothetical protein